MKKKKSWLYRYWQGDVRLQKTFESKAEKDAFIARRLLGKKDVVKGSTMTFAALADIWLENHCRHNKAASQYGADKRTIDGYLIPAFGHVALRDLRSTHLADLKLSLQNGRTLSKGKIKAKTINNIIALGKAMLTMATKTGDPVYLPANPFTIVEMAAMDDQPFDYWTAEERDRFLQFCRNVDPKFAELVLVASHTGLRRSELAGLRRGHLNFERRIVTVSETYCFATRSRQQRTKNRRTAWVPMNEAVMETFKDRQLMAMDAPVFDSGLIEFASGKLRRYAEVFEMRPIRFHDLRHTFASTLAMAGVPLYDVQRLMRHESSKMTEKYAHLSPGHLVNSAQAICGTPRIRLDAADDSKVLKMQG